jgi:mRNA interferase RelE/StbE
MTDSHDYSLEITDNALQNLKKIGKPHAPRIVNKLKALAQMMPDVKHKALKGEWLGYYRCRIGDYRAIYSIDHAQKIVMVHFIGHRKEIYDG